MARIATLAGGVIGTAPTTWTNTLADNVTRRVVINIVNKSAGDVDLNHCTIATPGINGGIAVNRLPTNLTLEAKSGGVQVDAIMMPGAVLSLQAGAGSALEYTVEQHYSEAGAA